MELVRIAYGSLLGAVYSVLNWSRKLADRRREDVKGFRSFSMRRLLVHLVAGAIAGAIVAVQGDEISPNSIEMVLANMGLVPLVENIGMFILYTIDQKVYNFVPEKREKSFFQ